MSQDRFEEAIRSYWLIRESLIEPGLDMHPQRPDCTTSSRAVAWGQTESVT